MKKRLRQSLTALLLLFTLLGQGTWALAGTTGGLSGTVTDASTGAPIAGAKVTVTSPSESATRYTDSGGNYVFLSLAPDSYTVSVTKDKYQDLSQAGVTVFADNTSRADLHMQPTLQTIAHITSRAAGALVKSGVTADAYSVNAETAAKAAVLGGGGALNQAYSAVATVPGVYVPTGSNGWNQTILIRGGDYSQVGYEYDGVPVNRSFDNYPAHTASALGQQELQVYAGSSPANAESTGLAGFINQVIRTGTYPGFTSFDLGVGTPSFYHKFSLEAGGATPSHSFSWYVGLGGFNQGFRYVNQQNGAQFNTLYGPVFGAVAPGFNPNTGSCAGVANPQNYPVCYAASAPYGSNSGIFGPGAGGDGGFVGPGNGYVQGPYPLFDTTFLSDRENVVNLHWAIPHRNGYRDDLQLLYTDSVLNSSLMDSASDWNLVNAAGGACLPLCAGPFANPPSSFTYSGPMGQPVTAASNSLIHPYTFPQQDAGTNIAFDRRGGYWNDDSIAKLQYTHNMGSNAYLRVYGYSFYSDWLNNDPNSVSGSNPIGQGLIPEYELDTHTRGVSAQLADQITPQHLLNVQASTVHSTVVRYNNSTEFHTGEAIAVAQNAPNSGVCYTLTGGVSTPTDCFGITGSPTTVSLDNTFASSYAGVAPMLATSTCNSGPCELLAVENGVHGTLNQVAPTFNAYSITDQYHPTDRLLFNFGLRYETFQFQGVNTEVGARPFWFAAYNNAFCIPTTSGGAPVAGASPSGISGFNAATGTGICPSGSSLLSSSPQTAVINQPAINYFYHVIEPRFGGTFTINPLNVIRFSYGRYAEPGNSAAEQYNVAQQDLPAFLGSIFYPYGFHMPGHNIPPETSNNYDLSWEHQFKGTDMSMKITPFIRQTQGEQTSFFIDPLQAFVSSIPVGNLSSKGVEFAFSKGDFNRNGWAGQLAFTYTYTTINYTALPNGGTPLSVINNDIAQFNAYTSACAGANAGRTLSNGIVCGTPTNGVGSSACYTTTGAPAACAAGTIANPYWNATPQANFNLNGPYWPTDTVVSTTGLGADSYAVPYVATLLLNYKHDKWSFTPSLQFAGGQRYGTPEATEGIDPAAGCGALPGTLSPSDPRYMGGTSGLTGGSGYDATTCAGVLRAIPDIYNGNHFDNIAQFVSPNQLLGNLMISYEASPKITLQLTMANVFDACFGGSKEPWTTALGTNKTCAYVGTAGAFVANPVGNFYNPSGYSSPASTINTAWQYPYQPYFGVYNPDSAAPNAPFNAYFDVQIKL